MEVIRINDNFDFNKVNIFEKNKQYFFALDNFKIA